MKNSPDGVTQVWYHYLERLESVMESGVLEPNRAHFFPFFDDVGCGIGFLRISFDMM
jgi:hypothetical protein